MSKRHKRVIDDEFVRIMEEEMAKCQARLNESYVYKRALRLQVLGEVLGRYRGVVNSSISRQERLELELAFAKRELEKLRGPADQVLREVGECSQQQVHV